MRFALKTYLRSNYGPRVLFAVEEEVRKRTASKNYVVENLLNAEFAKIESR